jgi:hypothetical protein
MGYRFVDRGDDNDGIANLSGKCEMISENETVVFPIGNPIVCQVLLNESVNNHRIAVRLHEYRIRHFFHKKTANSCMLVCPIK